jgi:hypothetical protein
MRISYFGGRLVLGLALLLAACDDKQAASDENFQKALQAYYDDHPDCLGLSFTLPIEVSAGTDDLTRHQVEALAKAGLLSASPEASSVRYAPSADGAKVFRPPADSFLGGTTVCYARRKIMKIATFTAPAEMLGVKASRVTYDYRLEDIVPWSQDEAVKAAFPQIANALGGGTETDGVVLTPDGWKREKSAL